MTKRFCVFVLLFYNICNSLVILPDNSTKNLTVVNKVLITLLTECNLRLRNIVFYDQRGTDLLSTQLTISPLIGPESWILESYLQPTKYEKISRSIVIDGYIAVLNSYKENLEVLNHIIYHWRCSKNCTVVILFKLPGGCDIAATTLQVMGYAHFDIIYYICLDNDNIPRIITHDPHGNIKPPRWRPIVMPSSLSYPWTLYYRRYNKNLCRDFHFNRSIPKEIKPIMIGVLHTPAKGETVYQDTIYSENLDQLSGKAFTYLLLLLQRLLNVKFTVTVRSLPMESEEIIHSCMYFWYETPTDILYGHSIMWEDYRFVWSNPTAYSSKVILSHNPGFATPLEKITQFYGIWTLISLILILILTFVVIYSKTNRHTASAAFDCLSLLINSGVTIPINTLPLRIFFCMVFLYFMVIHATFSGNLPKFLTIPQIRSYPNSMKDLANPQITTIYVLENEDRFADQNDTIFKKIKSIQFNKAAFDEFIRDPNSVLIMPQIDATMMLYDPKYSDKICTSTNYVGSTIAAAHFRRRFFYQEKFNWAITYIFDIHVDNQQEQLRLEEKWRYERRKARSEIDFRPIAINDVKFAFIFLGIGNILGLICFVIEFVIAKKYYQRGNWKNLKKITALKQRKQRIKVRRIVVKPTPIAIEVNH